uniref:Interleukin-1 receptor antagonist protein n=2 Tax=Gallus gallus TaxID=9031 RepID=H2A076_CHICK|nr:secretory interleukin-1 receptor antagonist [Gallus gallus]
MALTIALLLLHAEAAGSVPCRAPALQTKVFKYRIWDMNQQSLYLRDDQLVAGHLQGANAALEEKVFWVPNRFFKHELQPVIMGIRNGTRCLACPAAPQPTLQLQDGLWRFESAANPGWFLCTSARAHQPLGLSRRPDAAHVLDFYFQLC